MKRRPLFRNRRILFHRKRVRKLVKSAKLCVCVRARALASTTIRLHLDLSHDGSFQFQIPMFLSYPVHPTATFFLGLPLHS